MSVTFTAEDLRGIQEASARILSVLDRPSLDEWADEVMATVCSLVRGDRAFLAVPDGEDLRIFWSDPELSAALASYQDEFAPYDFLLQERGRERGPDGYVLPVLADDRELGESVVWNEWALPHRLCDVAGLALYDLELPLPPLLNVYHDRPETSRFGERELAIFRLLHPSFRAAAGLVRRLDGTRARVPAGIDRLTLPLLILDEEGRVLHRNEELRRRTGLPEVERRVMDAARELARRVLARSGPDATNGRGPAAATGVRVDGGVLGSFELEGVPLDRGVPGRDRTVLIHVRPLSAPLPEPGNLRERFGLTRRESEVAVLLVRRFTNHEIAETLCISPHTARHHTEHVFGKLGVHSRDEAARLLADRAAGPGPG